MNNIQLRLRKRTLVFTLKTEILSLPLWLPSLSVVQIKSCQSIQELGRQMQLVQKRGSSQCIKFLSAFPRCILLGYLLSLNRKLFQIDRQTERCAECVNWNRHIYPSPHQVPAWSLLPHKCGESARNSGFFSFSPITPHLLQRLVLFLNSLPRCFRECLQESTGGAGAPVVEAAEQGWGSTAICVRIVPFRGFTL